MKYIKPTTEVVNIELVGTLLNMSDPNNKKGEGIQYSKSINPDSWDEEYEE